MYFGQNNTMPSNWTGVFLATSTGAYLSASGIWHSNSDRNRKTNISAIDPEEVLAEVSTLPITSWNYKIEDGNVRHIGPMAQDFHSTFGLDGADSTHISTIDESGVALAAIQALAHRTAEIQTLKEENRQLSARLEELETLVKKLAAQSSNNK